MRILIFGQGQLGTFYKEYFEEKGVPVFNPKLDIRNVEAVTKAVEDCAPNVLINAAAKTNLDWCEQERLQCFDVNTLGADIVGKVCETYRIYLVHLSSGCVQESKSGQDVHTEQDPVHPISFYSWTKVWAEELLMDRANFGALKVLILRPRQLLSSKASPRNALTKLLTYKKFIDTANSCTIVEDLMWVTEELINKHATGIVNIVNPGIITPYRIAEILKEEVDHTMEFVKISKDELNAMTLAKRIDSVLDTPRLRELNITLSPIEPRLREIVRLFKHNLSSADGVAALAKTRFETIQKLHLKQE